MQKDAAAVSGAHLISRFSSGAVDSSILKVRVSVIIELVSQQKSHRRRIGLTGESWRRREGSEEQPLREHPHLLPRQIPNYLDSASRTGQAGPVESWAGSEARGVKMELLRTLRVKVPGLGKGTDENRDRVTLWIRTRYSLTGSERGQVRF